MKFEIGCYPIFHTLGIRTQTFEIVHVHFVELKLL